MVHVVTWAVALVFGASQCVIFRGKEGFLALGFKDMMLVRWTATSIAFVVNGGKMNWKSEDLVSRSSAYCIPLSGLSYKYYK